LRIAFHERPQSQLIVEHTTRIRSMTSKLRRVEPIVLKLAVGSALNKRIERSHRHPLLRLLGSIPPRAFSGGENRPTRVSRLPVSASALAIKQSSTTITDRRGVCPCASAPTTSLKSAVIAEERDNDLRFRSSPDLM
jgi:hypothetical protein